MPQHFLCSFDPVTCLDVDECEEGTDLCNGNALCNNNIGSYECVCMEGYEGDGFECNGKVILIIYIDFTKQCHFCIGNQMVSNAIWSKLAQVNFSHRFYKAMSLLYR